MNNSIRFVFIVLVLVALIGGLFALFIDKQISQNNDLNVAFSIIQKHVGEHGYIISTGLVDEKSHDITTVYIVYNGDNVPIYQWPEWTKDLALG